MQANQPDFFNKGPKPLTRVLIFSALSVGLIVGDASFQLLNQVRDKLSLALYPLQWLATTPINALIEGKDYLHQQTLLVSENKALNNDKLAAKGMEMRLHALEIENANLRSLTIASESSPRKAQLTKILYNSRDPFAAKLVLDKGQQNEISAGQIVLDASGVVGQIVRVQPLTSEVRLLSDRNHMVPVIVERNQMRTVTYGSGRHVPLEVRNMAPNVDIQVGDRLLTSGIDSIYPAGLPVAKVTKVERTTGNAFARIYSEPLAQIDQNRYFLILDAPAPPPPYPTEASAPKAKKH